MNLIKVFYKYVFFQLNGEFVMTLGHHEVQSTLLTSSSVVIARPKSFAQREKLVVCLSHNNVLLNDSISLSVLIHSNVLILMKVLIISDALGKGDPRIST